MREPTRRQRWMIFLFTVAAVALMAFGIIELMGVFDPTPEDTFTEWVADLELWAVLLIGGLSLLVGIAAVWSFGHYLEWWHARRRR